MSFEGGGRTEKEEKKKEKEKFALCVKAWVISPFGAAAQKGTTDGYVFS